MGHGLSGSRATVAGIVQARMTSTRLPGKSLAALGSHTVLGLLLHRLASVREFDVTAVATSTDSSDDAIAQAAERLSVHVVRGPLPDVLGRYLQACDALEADAVVRITADCPFSDPEVIDQVVARWRVTGADYVTNTLAPRSYPDGFDVEVIGAVALRRLGALAEAPADREHVTTYIRAHPHHFDIAELRLEPSFGNARFTLDTAEDLELMRRVVAEVGPDASMWQILEELGLDPAATVMHVP
jgi:spore coat polysaccharide biosynthesis protein SpsF